MRGMHVFSYTATTFPPLLQVGVHTTLGLRALVDLRRTLVVGGT